MTTILHSSYNDDILFNGGDDDAKNDKTDHIQRYPVPLTWWAITHKGVTHMHFSVIHLVNLSKSIRFTKPDWCHCIFLFVFSPLCSVSNQFKILIQFMSNDLLLKVFGREKKDRMEMPMIWLEIKTNELDTISSYEIKYPILADGRPVLILISWMPSCMHFVSRLYYYLMSYRTQTIEPIFFCVFWLFSLLLFFFSNSNKSETIKGECMYVIHLCVFVGVVVVFVRQCVFWILCCFCSFVRIDCCWKFDKL